MNQKRENEKEKTFLPTCFNNLGQSETITCISSFFTLFNKVFGFV